MAKLVLGLASSHSPQMSTAPDLWPVLGENDKQNPDLTNERGEPAQYDELLAVADPAVQKELTAEKFQSRYEACQTAIAKLGETLAAAKPDVVVIVGDDQEELFQHDNMPAMLVYWGETVENIPMSQLDPVPRPFRLATWAYGEEEKLLPVAAGLGRHVIDSLIADEFDIAHSRRLRPGHTGIGHAFAFVARRLMNGSSIPILPIMLNTYYPPNQPTPRRCFQLGKALRRAIDSWQSDARVALVASGGLSHFRIEPDFDQTVLKALRDKDAETLCTLPRYRLNSGSSEIRNWIVAGAALQDFDMELIDYVTCYRSPAGTGGAWAFAQWT